MNRADFQDLANLRIAEAECLFQSGMFDGAYYLAGYAVEAGLKTGIAKLVSQYDFPSKNAQRDCYTHDLEILLKTAGLGTIMEVDRKANAVLDSNWKVVVKWKEDSRYNSRGLKSNAITLHFLQAITNDPDGVLTWIRKRW